MTPTEVADEVDRLLVARLPKLSDRTQAMRIIRRRMAHPERGAHPSEFYIPPPPSTGDCAANRAGQMCAQCGWQRSSHDIDGQRKDCDGFVPAP